MPRVSEEHLEQRREQILDAALTCFLRKGFHETVMQDIFTEAGMSPGAVYRYFRSKNAIIEAIGARALSGILDGATRHLEQDPPPPINEAAAALSRLAAEANEQRGILRLAPHAWSMALLSPEFAIFVRDRIIAFRDIWIRYAQRLHETGMLAPETDPEAVGKTLFGLLPGFILQHLLVCDVTPEDLDRGMRALATPSALSAPGDRAG